MTALAEFSLTALESARYPTIALDHHLQEQIRYQLLVQPPLQPHIITCCKPRFVDSCELANERENGHIGNAQTGTGQILLRFKQTLQTPQKLFRLLAIVRRRMLRIAIGVLVTIEPKFEWPIVGVDHCFRSIRQ